MKNHVFDIHTDTFLVHHKPRVHLDICSGYPSLVIIEPMKKQNRGHIRAAHLYGLASPENLSPTTMLPHIAVTFHETSNFRAVPQILQRSKL